MHKLNNNHKGGLSIIMGKVPLFCCIVFLYNKGFVQKINKENKKIFGIKNTSTLIKMFILCISSYHILNNIEYIYILVKSFRFLLLYKI